MSDTIIDIVNPNNEQHSSQKAPALFKGVVVENNNPKHQGYVRVEELEKEDGKNVDEELWAHLLPKYSGIEYGSYAVPEIDDTVLVGYVSGDLTELVILGCLYDDGDSMVSESFDDNNYVKHFKTKGGVDILINDEDGKQSITVTTPKESVILIEDENKTCLISDKEKKNKMLFDFENDKIEVLADKEIKLKSKNVELVLDGEKDKLSFKAKEIGMDGGSSMDFSTKEFSLSGSSSVDITGGQININ